MSAADLAQVLASYARCREREGFVETFYRQLWSRSPGIARRFENTDMERQQLVMRDAINTLLMYAQGSEVAAMALDRIAKLHGRGQNDVPPELYRPFVEALLDTVRAWDARWIPELEPKWRAALSPGIERMSRQY